MPGRKYRKVKIDKEVFNHIEDHPLVTMAFQLSRMSNALMTWMRIYLSASRSRHRIDTLLKFEGKFNISIQHAAVLFEVIKTFVGMSDRLPRFRLTSFDLFQIEKWKRDFLDPNNFVSKMLKPIRNKIAFHFEYELLCKLIKRVKFDTDRVFAIGAGPTKHDTFFPAPDELILNFIAERMPKDIPEVDRYNAFSENVVVLAGSLSSLIDSITKELLRSYGNWVEEPA